MLVVIPAKDESKTVARIVSEIRRRYDCAVVVVNDASHDDTAQVAQDAGAVVLNLPFNLGAWGAMRTGLRYAEEHGCGIVVTMDADGQHLASAIDDLSRPILTGRADVTIGSCTSRGSPARQIAWVCYRRLTGLDIDDLTSGFRAFNNKALHALLADETAMFDYQDIGVLMHLKKHGCRMLEVPVDMCARANGKSRIFSSWARVFVYIAVTLVLVVTGKR